jgi:uncharacterized membrane protein
MMYWGNHMGTSDWIFSILGTVILVGLIVALVVWVVSPRSDRGGSASATGESPREILDRRLAGGELTPEQYSQLHETLDGAAANSRPRDPAGSPG